jgi:hypothetical protein
MATPKQTTEPIPPPETPPPSKWDYVRDHGDFVIQEYMRILERPPDANELITDSENVAKYGEAQLTKTLTERATNTPQ